MVTPAPYTVWHGFDTPTQRLRQLRAGPLSCALDGIDLRYVRVGGVEVVRRIYVSVRDRNWDTIPGEASKVQVDDGGDRFEVRFSVRHLSADIDFAWRGVIAGTPSGRISFAFDGTAERELLYNRIGFCVLHPCRETAGRPYRASTRGGEVAGVFPRLVGQQRFENGVYVPLFPSFDRLQVDLEAGGTVAFEFEGDLWEDEDQRNWTDASFKTYCTPLALGFPHLLEADHHIVQRVTVSVPELPSGREPEGPTTLRVGSPLGRALPAVGLAAPADGVSPTDGELELLRALQLDHLRVETWLDRPNWADALTTVLADRARLDVPLELAVFLLPEHADELEQLAAALDGVPIARVLAFPADARSATPTETTPAALVRLVRVALAAVPVVGGTDMNFCELNRTRPDTDAMDGITYAIAGQIHASDDLSLVETLEAQGETVISARAFAHGRPISVSPVTLKRRFNAYATAGEAEHDECELPDSVDPRQLSLLGAAWTVGSAKNLAEAGVASLTYYETTGWRGVLERESGPKLPAQFPSQPGRVFPLYHVLADLGAWKGSELVECSASDPLAVVGFAVRHEGRTSLLVANLKPEMQLVRLVGIAGPTTLRRLNENTIPGRSEPKTAESASTLELAPFETVRIDQRGRPSDANQSTRTG